MFLKKNSLKTKHKILFTFAIVKIDPSIVNCGRTITTTETEPTHMEFNQDVVCDPKKKFNFPNPIPVRWHTKTAHKIENMWNNHVFCGFFILPLYNAPSLKCELFYPGCAVVAVSKCTRSTEWKTIYFEKGCWTFHTKWNETNSQLNRNSFRIWNVDISVNTLCVWKQKWPISFSNIECSCIVRAN